MDTWMELNSSDNVVNEANDSAGNSTLTAEIEKAPIYVTVVSLLLIAWIVLGNSTMVWLLSRHDTMKKVGTIQILTLAITDVIAGMSGLPILMTFYILGFLPYYGTCAFIVGFYSISQTAALFQMCGICLYRVMISLRSSVVTQTRHPYITLALHVTLPWTLASIIIAAIYYIYGVNEGVMRYCSLNTLMRENYGRCSLIIVNVWLVTEVLIILAYTFMCIRLVVMSRKKSAQHISVGRLSNIGHLKKVADAANIPQPSCSQTTAKLINDGGTARMPEPQSSIANANQPELQHRGGNSSISEPQGNVQNAGSRSSISHISVAQSDKRAQETGKTRSRAPLGQWQKSVLITIGILLVLMIVCVTPWIIVRLLEDKSNPLSRKAKFLLGGLSLLNSAVNPFVYGTRNREIRDSIKRTWTRVRCACVCYRVAAVNVP